MIKLTPEDVAKFHENIAKWLRNKKAAEDYKEFPHLHTGLSPAGRHRTLIAYTRQPVDEPQYGLEIELDFTYTDLMVLPDLRQGVAAGIKQCLCEFDLLKHGISIERDDSLSEGLEVVLPPMPLSMLRRVLRKLYRVHGMQFVRNHASCGIHITTDPFPDEASAVAFWNFWQNPNLVNGKLSRISDIIGREPTEHCRQYTDMDSLSQIMQLQKVNTRGAAAYRSNGCMEVRLFHSVMDADKVFRQVQLVDAVYRLCVLHNSALSVLPLIRKRFNKK